MSFRNTLVIALLAAQSLLAAPISTDETKLGICYLSDGYTNVARQFALHQLIRNNPIVVNGKALDVVLTDHPYNSSFAITGSVTGQVLNLKFWENGKTSGSEVIKAESADLKDVLAAAYAFISTKLKAPVTSRQLSRLSYKGIIVLPTLQAKAQSGSDLLPGSVPCPVAPTEHLRALEKGKINFVVTKKLKSYKDAVQIAQLGEALYVRQPESFFLLRNNDIPAELKESVRKLMFPVWSRPGLPVIYLAAGEKFEKNGDVHAASNAYLAALIACNSLNTSPFERSLIKGVCFRQLSGLARGRSQLISAELAGLASEITDQYLASEHAKTESANYYQLMDKIGETCHQIEMEVRRARSQRRNNGFIALINGVAAVASTENSAASDIYSDQAVDAMSQSTTLNFALQSSLQEVAQSFQAFDQIIDQKLQDKGESVVGGKTYLAEEISHQLLRDKGNEVEVKLTDFSNDKPVLNALVEGYKKATTSHGKVQEARKIQDQLRKIESLAYVYETRGLQVPDNLKKTF